MQRNRRLIVVITVAALLTASCKSSTKGKVTAPLPKVSAIATASATPAPATSASATPTPLPPPPPATSAPASPSASPTSTASAPASPSGSLKPTDLDPCQLVTQDEASTLAHATFGPGREVASPGHPKGCIYGSQTKNVLDVVVAQSADEKTAQAAFAQAQAQAQAQYAQELPPGVHVDIHSTSAEGIGDKATTVSWSYSGGAVTIAFAGIYVLQGNVFFTIGDLSTATTTAASVADLKTQAQTTLGRI